MWAIYEHNRVAKQLVSLPDDILKRYEKWKDIVMIAGPEGLKSIAGFRDEALKGKWRGYRSSRLSIQYRIIYRIERERVLVRVIQITPLDYRRL